MSKASAVRWPVAAIMNANAFHSTNHGARWYFGPWEQIFYGEFDGNCRKRVLVKIIGE